MLTSLFFGTRFDCARRIVAEDVGEAGSTLIQSLLLGIYLCKRLCSKGFIGKPCLHPERQGFNAYLVDTLAGETLDSFYVLSHGAMTVVALAFYFAGCCLLIYSWLFSHLI